MFHVLPTAASKAAAVAAHLDDHGFDAGRAWRSATPVRTWRWVRSSAASRWCATRRRGRRSRPGRAGSPAPPTGKASSRPCAPGWRPLPLGRACGGPKAADHCAHRRQVDRSLKCIRLGEQFPDRSETPLQIPPGAPSRAAARAIPHGHARDVGPRRRRRDRGHCLPGNRLGVEPTLAGDAQLRPVKPPVETGGARAPTAPRGSGARRPSPAVPRPPPRRARPGMSRTSTPVVSRARGEMRETRVQTRHRGGVRTLSRNRYMWRRRPARTTDW